VRDVEPQGKIPPEEQRGRQASEEDLVGQRVQDLAQAGDLSKTAGDVPVQDICCRRQQQQDHGGRRSRVAVLFQTVEDEGKK